jgi:hypothetical protein
MHGFFAAGKAGLAKIREIAGRRRIASPAAGRDVPLMRAMAGWVSGVWCLVSLGIFKKL